MQLTTPPLPFNAGTEKEILLGPLLTTAGTCLHSWQAIVAVRIMDNRRCPAAGAWAAEMVFRLPWRERHSGKELISLTTGKSWPQHLSRALCKMPSGVIHGSLTISRANAWIICIVTDEETGIVDASSLSSQVAKPGFEPACCWIPGAVPRGLRTDTYLGRVLGQVPCEKRNKIISQM